MKVNVRKKVTRDSIESESINWKVGRREGGTGVLQIYVFGSLGRWPEGGGTERKVSKGLIKVMRKEELLKSR